MHAIRAGRLREAVVLLTPRGGGPEGGYSALHLGHAWRFLGVQSEAVGHFQRALAAGETARDRPLTVAALCGAGESALERRDRRAALTHFGRALGLTELGGVSAALPLAGLAQTQLLWHNRGKATRLAERALERATALRDAAGEARACLSLGLATGEVAVFERGRRAAQAAPLRPLELRLWLAVLERAPEPISIQRAHHLALELEMAPEIAQLGALEASRIDQNKGQAE